MLTRKMSKEHENTWYSLSSHKIKKDLENVIYSVLIKIWLDTF